MPHSVEAEQAVLGSMLIDARCVPEVIDQLRSDDFYVRQNREIYDTIYSMFNYSLTIDPVTVLEHMKQNGVYDENTSGAICSSSWTPPPPRPTWWSTSGS